MKNINEIIADLSINIACLLDEPSEVTKQDLIDLQDTITALETTHNHIMKGNTTNQVCWYRKGMNSFLSDKGFVHFYSKEAMNEDFKEGIPYIFNYAEKTFGKCDLVFDHVKASKISNRMVSEMREESPSHITHK